METPANMEFEIQSVPHQDVPSFLEWMHSHEPKQVPRIQASLTDLLAINPHAWQARQVRRDGELAAGVYCSIHPGNLGILVGPRSTDGTPSELPIAITRSLIEQVIQSSGILIQSIVPSEDQHLPTRLTGAGMTKLATLAHLMTNVSGSLIQADDVQSIQSIQANKWNWVGYDSNELETWLDLISATYDETQDCPAINGVRDVRDTWTGYHSSAKGNTSEWWLLFEQKQPIACLLMTPITPTAWEITYMGVHPLHRGKGVGSFAIAYALERAKQQGKDWLFLTVDVQNKPAYQLYTQFGFYPTQIVDAWFAR